MLKCYNKLKSKIEKAYKYELIIKEGECIIKLIVHPYIKNEKNYLVTYVASRFSGL